MARENEVLNHQCNFAKTKCLRHAGGWELPLVGLTIDGRYLTYSLLGATCSFNIATIVWQMKEMCWRF